jgi:hypothetical protein
MSKNYYKKINDIIYSEVGTVAYYASIFFLAVGSKFTAVGTIANCLVVFFLPWIENLGSKYCYENYYHEITARKTLVKILYITFFMISEAAVKIQRQKLLR